MSEDRTETRTADDVDESFLERWSRRKTLAREGVTLTEPAAEPAAPGRPDSAGEDAPASEPPGASPVAPASDPVELPPLETLDENADFSPFMASDVSPDVRRQALHKLFHSPKFNVRDGLDDYDLDYSNPEPLGNIVTAEMRRRMMLALERLADEDSDVNAAPETVATVDAASDTAEAEEVQPEPEQDANDERPATS